MVEYLTELYGLQEKIAALMGGGGYLTSEMSAAFARVGVKVAQLDIHLENPGRWL